MKISDTQFLRSKQYRDAGNLNARAAIHQNFSTNPQGWFNWLFQQADIQPGERLLEVGGGPGYLWQQYLAELPAGCRLVLSDFSPGMVSEARQALAGASTSVHFAVLDAQQIPFPSESFERVMANYMLYHVPDRPRAIAEIWRVLRPGGVLLAATNGPAHLREILNFMRRAINEPPEGPAPWGTTFDLENGAAQLSAFFPRVELRRYPDSLRVTQVQPILDYLYSMWEASEKGFDENAVAELRHDLEEQIHREGAVAITKESGLFIAHK
jgi:SAM-dependent methyltransferase